MSARGAPEDLETETASGERDINDVENVSGGPTKNAAAQALGQLGGRKRASNMSPERRSEIARLAARRRWDNT
jgi:hypothetical protein